MKYYNADIQKGKLQVISVLLVYLFTCLPFASAQTVKSITVSDETSYTDHIALKSDATDKDLMVKFIFNEDANTFTVSLISYRRLFVFWDDTRYKGTVGCHRRLRTDRLPYVVTGNPDDVFKLGKAYKKTLPKPRKKYIFKKWIAYDGLQPVDQERNMVNDYIEQTFDIQGKRTFVIVRLRDLLLMDETGQKGKSHRYELSFGKDLDTEYQVTIDRNPCFGLDEEMGAARNALAAIAKSYAAFKKKYGSGKVSTQEGLATFKDLKATLLGQYALNTDSSACPVIQSARQAYNQLVDSISLMTVALDQGNNATMAVMGSKGRLLNAKVITANARQIDTIVARWVNSNDGTERSDLVKQGQSIINDTNVIIRSGSADTPESRKAVSIFRQAAQYFLRICK